MFTRYERKQEPVSTPLTLEQIGVAKQDIPNFCKEALDWLGADINPTDIRKSKIVEKIDTKYHLRKKDAASLSRYDLMFRLAVCIGFEEYSKGLDDLLTSVGPSVNSLSVTSNSEEVQTVATLFENRYEVLGEIDYIKLRRTMRYRDIQDIPLEDRSDDKIYSVQFAARQISQEFRTQYVTWMGNFYHDLENSANLQVISANFQLLSMIFKRKGETDLQRLEEIGQFWQNGKAIRVAQSIIKGHQEVVLPGYGEARCKPVDVLTTIGGYVSRRFNLSLSINGQVVTPRTDARGIITIVSENPEEDAPVSEGGLVIIANNLIKNTAKAADAERSTGKPDKPLVIEITTRRLNSVYCIGLKDNGPGFDLNVPLTAIALLTKKDPGFLDELSASVSPHMANITREYLVDKHPFAIYPLTLEELFKLFLVRRISGKIVGEIKPDTETSGIGLSSAKAIIARSCGGDIWVTNHPDGGTFTLMAFPEDRQDPRPALTAFT